jgi:hypothetical protein
MKIRMLVSLMEMPAWTIREEGQVYDLPTPAAAAYIAGGLAVRVDSPVERAVMPEAEVSDPPIQRGRKGRG